MSPLALSLSSFQPLDSPDLTRIKVLPTNTSSPDSPDSQKTTFTNQHKLLTGTSFWAEKEKEKSLPAKCTFCTKFQLQYQLPNFSSSLFPLKINPINMKMKKLF